MPIYRRLGGPQIQSGRCGRKTESLAVTGNLTLAALPVTHRNTDSCPRSRPFHYRHYCNGFDQRVAKQQLCKYSPLLGYATMKEAVFRARGDVTTGDSEHVTILLR
jgi:hypothetical protein